MVSLFVKKRVLFLFFLCTSIFALSTTEFVKKRKKNTISPTAVKEKIGYCIADMVHDTNAVLEAAVSVQKDALRIMHSILEQADSSVYVTGSGEQLQATYMQLQEQRTKVADCMRTLQTIQTSISSL